MKLVRGYLWSLAVLLLLIVILFWGFWRAHGQSSAAPPPNDPYVYTARAAVVNPDNGKMGIYRSLAQLTYQAYVEKDDKEAGVLARILEKVWDREQSGLRTSSPETWGKIDKSLDAFIKPLIASGTTGGRAYEPTVSKTYQQFLAELAAAD